MTGKEPPLLWRDEPQEKESHEKRPYGPNLVMGGRKSILSDSFRRSGIDRYRLHTCLQIMGRKWLHRPDMEWSSANPTRNYCYVVAEWLHRYIAPSGSILYKVSVPGDEEFHRFNVWSDSGSVVDLTCEQFSERTEVPYHEAKPYVPMQMAGKMPSKRAQLLNHLYKGGIISSFKYIQNDRGPWKNPANPVEWWEDLLKNWSDPYESPIIRTYDLGNSRRIQVVRDDLLNFGSKARFADALLSLHPRVREWVYGSCPAQGFGQVSLAAATQSSSSKKTILFMAARSVGKRTAQQIRAMSLGAKIYWVDNGFLTVTESRARKYVAEDPKHRALVPIGLDDPAILAAIIKIARSLPISRVKEVWTVAGSGTLSRGLQMAFPNAVVNAVAVGHELTWAQRGRAKVWRHPLRFEQEVPKEDLPPYPSLRNYDAKVWSFIHKYGNSGALIWNVA